MQQSTATCLFGGRYAPARYAVIGTPTANFLFLRYFIPDAPQKLRSSHFAAVATLRRRSSSYVPAPPPRSASRLPPPPSLAQLQPLFMIWNK